MALTISDLDKIRVIIKDEVDGAITENSTIKDMKVNITTLREDMGELKDMVYGIRKELDMNG